jgi:sugar phosphate isomerase/epimerase
VPFQQTTEHRSGKNSYHQIGVCRGQFGDIPEAEWLDFIGKIGFDGWEEASWELDLARCGTDDGAQAYAAERIAEAQKRGLEIFTISAHLQGQALGDEPSAKTLQFIGGEPLEAYKAWRAAGNNPPRTNPVYLPDDVAELVRKAASEAVVNCVRLAHFLGKAQNRTVPVTGFTGSPAHCWSHWFLFPPVPTNLGGHDIPDVFKVSLELLVERFAPVFDACRKYGTKYGLECHPSERAMGDIESAGDYLEAMSKAGYGDVAGFNFDASHMQWQGVSGVEFIREFRDHIWAAHIKGVQVIDGYSRAGRLGGHRPMGHRFNGWNFVTAGTERDAVPEEEIIVELNRAGFDGAITVEWEDNDMEKREGARKGLANLHRIDTAPSHAKHDEMLKA